MTSAAVFDLDNTIVRGSSLFHFAKFLVRQRVLSARHVARFALAERRYASGAGEEDVVASRAALVALGLVAGVPRASMTLLADEFAARTPARHFDPRMLAEIKGQQGRGRQCFIATASPREIADAFVRRLGMDGCFATVAEVTRGSYTGRLVGPVCHGDAKAQRVRVGLAALGLELSESIVYSDSVNDLPLFASAGRAVAVNPDKELSAIAERHGWLVIPGNRDEWRASRMLAHIPFPL